jgi:DNA-binding response OmpR family regulator
METVYLVNLSSRIVDLTCLSSLVRIICYDSITKVKVAAPTDNSVIIIADTFPSQRLLDHCKDLMSRNSTWHIILLTCKPDNSFIVKGLEAGIEMILELDDAPDMICARIRSILKRNGQQPVGMVLSYGILLDDEARLLIKDHIRVPIRRKEYHILRALATAKGKTLTRTQLNQCSSTGWKITGDEVIDVHISNLRKAFDSLTGEIVIETVYGVGYRIRV